MYNYDNFCKQLIKDSDNNKLQLKVISNQELKNSNFLIGKYLIIDHKYINNIKSIYRKQG